MPQEEIIPRFKQKYLLNFSECDLLGYDYDISSRTCLKFNSTQLNWYDARQQCIDEGGDLITVETVKKMNFHNTSLNNCKSLFYQISHICKEYTHTSREHFELWKQ